MEAHLHPTLTLFVFTVILAICFPAIWCQETRPFDVCGQSVECGGIPIDYPFWGSDLPAYCGHPGFQLTCESNVPLLNYQSVNYRVLDTNTSTQTITIARKDLWANICPQFLYNTSYSSLFFQDDNFGQRNVSLYYECNTDLRLKPLGANFKFTCNVNDSESDGYFFRTDLIAPNMTNFLAQCKNHIDVPVNQSSAARLASTAATTEDLRSALMAGFNLQWTAPDDKCYQCIRSNGRCGSNLSLPELFVCYCDSGNFSVTCNSTNGSGGKYY
ncbi:hypothetical protein L2E82_18535 [Cichorium intybus]|uniref:Uncharacterized protein n=1 Tax=Cichorium intybus TaxID=13427 RepID=A0ACB9FB30_CICIN|nr:hypothetical protein L2E82_18535 [Cichorium intybus]